MAGIAATLAEITTIAAMAAATTAATTTALAALTTLVAVPVTLVALLAVARLEAAAVATTIVAATTTTAVVAAIIELALALGRLGLGFIGAEKALQPGEETALLGGLLLGAGGGLELLLGLGGRAGSLGGGLGCSFAGRSLVVATFRAEGGAVIAALDALATIATLLALTALAELATVTTLATFATLATLAAVLAFATVFPTGGGALGLGRGQNVEGGLLGGLGRLGLRGGLGLEGFGL